MKTKLNNREYEVYASYGGDNELILTLMNVKSIDELQKDAEKTTEVTITDDDKVIQVYRGYTIFKTIEKYMDGGNCAVRWTTEYDDAKALEIITGERPSIYQAEQFRADIEDIATFTDDETAEKNAWVFPVWKTDTEYKIDERVQYNGELFKCIQAHKSQADWTPDLVPALWKRISDPSIEYPEWIQPTGAHDSYSKGDKVSHNDKKWISLVDGNVWEPSVSTPTLWEEVK